MKFLVPDIPRLYRAALLAGLAVAWLAIATTANAESYPNVDRFCGPRCAQFVLRAFGQEVDLLTLVDEIQDRDWGNGSSMQDIASCLNRRGIHTVAIRIDDSADIIWPHPVLVHLSGTSNMLGHFVVQMPSTAIDRCAVWLGLSGVHVITHRQLANQRSGIVLLTAPTAIGSDAVASIRRSVRPRGITTIALTSLALAAAAAGAWHLCRHGVDILRINTLGCQLWRQDS